MTDSETTSQQLEEAKAIKGNIPVELSFEEVIKNNTLPVSLPVAEEQLKEEKMF